jgi:ABC-type antimicrobial peptide transport system permease subunit
MQSLDLAISGFFVLSILDYYFFEGLSISKVCFVLFVCLFVLMANLSYFKITGMSMKRVPLTWEMPIWLSGKWIALKNAGTSVSIILVSCVCEYLPRM